MINIDRYTQLKQSLVILETLYLKSVVEIGSQKVDIDALKVCITQLLDGIDKDMTLPVRLLTTKEAHLDLWDCAKMFNRALDKIEDNESTGDFSVEQRMYEYPDFKMLVEHFHKEKENGVIYNDLKKPTIKLLEYIGDAISLIGKFTNEKKEHPNLRLVEMLNLVNLIHTTEFIFELTNEHS